MSSWWSEEYKKISSALDRIEEIKEAGNVQKSVRESEREKREAGIENYDDHHVRQAIVHAREDIILLVPLMSHIFAQAKRINRRLSIIIALFAVLILILLFK